jgi:MFS family permease
MEEGPPPSSGAAEAQGVVAQQLNPLHHAAQDDGPVDPEALWGKADSDAAKLEEEEAELVDRKDVVRLFKTLILMMMVINYDSGAVPAVLNFVSEDFRLTPAEQGLLGGLQYIGLTVMSPIAGYLLQNKSAKKIICWSLVVINTLFCFLFAVSPNKGILLFCRLGIGITQAPVVIYAPVWVDEFSTGGNAATWLSILQGAAPLGVMVGYATSGYMADAG